MDEHGELSPLVVAKDADVATSTAAAASAAALRHRHHTAAPTPRCSQKIPVLNSQSIELLASGHGPMGAAKTDPIGRYHLATRSSRITGGARRPLSPKSLPSRYGLDLSAHIPAGMCARKSTHQSLASARGEIEPLDDAEGERFSWRVLCRDVYRRVQTSARARVPSCFWACPWTCV